MSRTLVHKRPKLKLGLPFHQPSVDSAFQPTSLPSFADGDQQTELNQTLPNGGQYIALTMCRIYRNVGGRRPSQKIGDQNSLHICSITRDDFET